MPDELDELLAQRGIKPPAPAGRGDELDALLAERGLVPSADAQDVAPTVVPTPPLPGTTPVTREMLLSTEGEGVRALMATTPEQRLVALANRVRMEREADPDKADRDRLLLGTPQVGPPVPFTDVGSAHGYLTRVAQESAESPKMGVGTALATKVLGPTAHFIDRIVPFVPSRMDDKMYEYGQSEAQRAIPGITGKVLGSVGELAPAMLAVGAAAPFIGGAAALGTYSAVQAPEGERLKAFATGAALGKAGEWMSGALIRTGALDRLPESVVRLIDQAGSNILLGAAARGGDFSEAGADAIVGGIMAAFLKNPALREARGMRGAERALLAEIEAAAKAGEAVMAKFRPQAPPGAVEPMKALPEPSNTPEGPAIPMPERVSHTDAEELASIRASIDEQRAINAKVDELAALPPEKLRGMARGEAPEPRPDLRQWPEAGRVAYDEALNIAQAGRGVDDVRRHLYRLPTEELVASGELVGIRAADRRELIYKIADAAVAEADLPGGPVRSGFSQPAAEVEPTKAATLAKPAPEAPAPPGAIVEPAPRVPPEAVSAPEAPAPRGMGVSGTRRGSGETGMARLPSVQELKDAGKAVLSPLKTLGRAAYEVWDRVGVDPFLRSLVDRVAARSGAGKGLADQVQRGLDMAREGYIRPMEPLYEQAASATNLSRVAGLQKPTFNPGENYGPSLLQEAIEGRMPGRGAPEQAGIDSLITYKDAKLLIEHKAGYMRDGPNGPEPIPQASKNAPQMVTAEGLDMIRGGNIPEVLLDGTIKETKRIQGVDVTKAEVTEHFLDLARTLEREGPQAAELRMASEMGRKYNFPGWLRVNGAEVPFLEVNGRRYLDRLHRAAPARYAVAMALGQGPDASGTAAVESFLGRDASAARDLLRAAGGGSLTEPLIRTNSPIAPLARGAGAVYSMFKSGALSLSGIKNMNEVFSGPGFVTGRYGRTLNAIWDTLSDYGGTVEGLVKQGLKTRERPDMTVDSRHLLSEYTKLGARLLREGGSGWAESIQETVVGRKAHLERAGIDTAVAMGQRLSGSDVALLRQYSDLTKPEMEALAKGGTLDVRRMAELTDQMTRRLVTEAQGSNVNPAQLSKFQHTHIGKSLAAFQHFVAMMTRQTYKGVKVGAEQIAMGIKNRDVHSVGSGVLTATRVPLGVTAGTIASALIGSFIVGGPEGIDGEWRRFRTDPIRYATRALVAGYTSGGLGGLTMALSEDNDLEDVIFAFRAFKEVGGMVGMNVDGGEKPYAGKSFLDRIGTLFERNVPVTKAFTTGAMAAIWQDDRSRSELMAARKSYWDFRERNGLTKGHGRDWEDTPWNVTMQKVYRSIMAKEPDSKWVDALFEGLDTGAFEGKEHQKDSVQASLRARLMLEGEGMNRQTLQALLADIGEDAYRALYTHDQMLKRVIDKLR